MRLREQGFSLIEVLAAVSLLIVLFIPLVRAAIDGLRSEGDSRRRMEASLLADNALAELESDLVIGIVPAVGEEPWEVREFRGITKVTSFELPEVIEENDSEFANQRIHEIGSLEGDLGAEQTIFPLPGSNEESPLRKIEITVSWPGFGDPDPSEGAAELRNRVVRTTFAFDLISVRPKLRLDLEAQADALEALLP